MAQPKTIKLVTALVVGGAILCSWCGLLSGVVGWTLGEDLGWRRGQAAAREEMPAALTTDPGVLVVRVVGGGPAARAGILPDDLIVAVGGEQVRDVPTLQTILAPMRSGDTITVTVRRGAAQKTLPLRLATFPGANRPYLGIYFTARAEEPGDL
jgi:membrane-associated protease RseP (regulator of RpoE activity)